ncbi:hypothetical protein GYMLUDRAFT_340436 [Collybiopsis luxurians FD-317 M1]|nr:hypothetical protein GYMLUDRAFT_340436 [Collybiopsis luxurians FD-317 M1]
MPLASSPSMVQHPGRKVHGIKKNTRQVNSSELEGSAKSVLRPSTRQARQVNQSRSDVDPHSSEETEDRAQSVVRTRPSTRQVNRLEPDADPDYLDVTEGAAEVNHSEPEIDPESFDVTERRAEPPRRFETSRRNAAPKRKAGTMEDTLDSDPAANLAAVQQDLEKARIAFKQAQIEQSEAIREKLLLLEEETKRLNEGTEKIRDDIHHFKRRKLQL